MDEKEAKMSKYARKQLAKQRGTWNAPEAKVVAVTPKSGGGLTAAEAKRIITDLGDLPEQIAALLAAAKDTLTEAHGLACAVVVLSGSGLQRAEPTSIRGCLATMADKVGEMAERARCIPNAKEAEE